MIKSYQLFFFITLALNLCAQDKCTFHTFRNSQQLLTSEECKVMLTIHRMFDGMRAGDSTAVRKTFHDRLEMYSVGQKADGLWTDTRKGSVQAFLEAVGSPHDELWDERLTSFDIKVDGPVAQVWTTYHFFIGETYSHSGNNFFTIARDASDDWKIIYIIDTRYRKEHLETITESW